MNNETKYTDRKGDWIQTYSGGRFYPFDPRVEDVTLDDIVHALAYTNRYGGHLETPISVLTHTLIVYHLVKRANGNRVERLWALLHDAAEAYIGDIPTPIKRNFPEFSEMEDKILRVVCEKFQLPFEMPALVKTKDYYAISIEKALAFPKAEIWSNHPVVANHFPDACKSNYF